MTRHDVVDGSILYTPIENPAAATLLEAGEAIAVLFVRSGYRMIAAERSRWQLKPPTVDQGDPARVAHPEA